MQNRLTRRQREKIEREKGQRRRRQQKRNNRIRNAIAGVALLIPISIGVVYGIYSQVADDSYKSVQVADIQNPLSEELKTSRDLTFVQGYIDGLIRTGRVPFRSTRVVYDPDFENAIKFWEDQGRRYPKRVHEAQSYIETLYKDIERLKKQREEFQSTGKF